VVKTIPDKWFGEPMKKWHALQAKYGTDWSLTFEYVEEHGDVLMNAVRRENDLVTMCTTIATKSGPKSL
jgi:hypothetical protein